MLHHKNFLYLSPRVRIPYNDIGEVERLAKERNSLLADGLYTENDDLIIELNQQIRALGAR
jgi:hypothetical protein